MGRLGSRVRVRPGARACMRAVVFLFAAALVAAFAPAAAATVGGGCTVVGTSTSGGSVDLTTTPVWHLRSTDQVSVSASAAFEQTEGSASAYALGFAIPISSGGSEGDTSFQSETYDVSLLALLGRVFVVAGASTGPFHACDGRVEIVIDDANPFLTVAGGGGVGVAFLGLFGLAWALRRPNSGWRRIVGLAGLAFLGAGTSLVLQQTSTPGSPGAAFGPSAFVASVAGPLQVSLDPTVLVQSALLTALVVLVMPFPSELFNSTLEANHEEIRGWFRRLPVIRSFVRPQPIGSVETGAEAGQPGRVGWSHPLAIAAFVLASALLYGLLDPGFGPHVESLVTYLGIVAALVAITLVAALPRRSMQMAATGERGRLRAVPATLGIAAACVLISRIAGFLPGYLYGLILGYQFVRTLDKTQNARAVAAGAWWMIGLSFVSWFALGAVRTPGIEPSVPAAIAESVFASFVVAGIEGIVFGLVPLRFLSGEPLFRWRRSRWGILYALGVFAFLWIILNPAQGFVGTAEETSFFSAVALFVGFGLASVVFWAYFRFRPTRAAV